VAAARQHHRGDLVAARQPAAAGECAERSAGRGPGAVHRGRVLFAKDFSFIDRTSRDGLTRLDAEALVKRYTHQANAWGLLWGEEATVGNGYKYRIKDFAAFYLGRITGTPIAFHEQRTTACGPPGGRAPRSTSRRGCGSTGVRGSFWVWFALPSARI
jgi:hypothetical protein